jgi:hypothetical protein
MQSREPAISPQVLGVHHQLCPTLEAEASLCGEPPECRAPNLRGEVRTEPGEDVMAQAVSTPKLMQVAVEHLMFHRSEAAGQDVVVRVTVKAMVPLEVEEAALRALVIDP